MIERRGGMRFLLESVLAVKRRDREPPFAYPPLTSFIFFTEALNEIGDSI
jgi:hypothetical protein